MENWYMLTMFGKDQMGVVARLSAALCKKGCNLGDSSMARLGGNFTIMLMVQFAGTAEELENAVKPIAGELNFKAHVDKVGGAMEHHVEPDVRINVYTSERKGIVEEVTSELGRAGLNILHLESNIGDRENCPTYFIHIEGLATQGIDPLYDALEVLSREKDMNTQLIPHNVGL